jgi:3-oxoacyl-[acyl-carrier-protein] synthase-1
MTERLVVLGFGAFTPVGLTSAQTCAAIRASLTGFVEWDLTYPLPDPDPILAARAPLATSRGDDELFDRLVAMASPALRECLQNSGHASDQTALLLGVREPFRTHPQLDGRNDELLRAIERSLPARFHPDSCVLPEGNPAVCRGIVQARQLLDSGKVKCCIIGGVDSLVNDYDFERFNATFRIKRAEVAQGFIPGEGAAFLAVTTRILAERQAALRGEILGVGLANEDPTVTVLSDGHPTGKGLQRALEATIQDAQLPESCIGFRVSDVNGEYYRGIESMLTGIRFYRTLREHPPIWLPAASVGEVGAAAGALLILVALTGIAKGYSPGVIAMCEASSHTGLAAGCLVSEASG